MLEEKMSIRSSDSDHYAAGGRGRAREPAVPAAGTPGSARRGTPGSGRGRREEGSREEMREDRRRPAWQMVGQNPRHVERARVEGGVQSHGEPFSSRALPSDRLHLRADSLMS